MEIIRRFICFICCAGFFFATLAGFSGCEKDGSTFEIKHAASVNTRNYTSFKDIPGITAEEIKAVENVLQNTEKFIYGMTYTTETFDDADGDIKGFSALVCERLTQLFGVEFVPVIYEWDELIEGLESGEIAFTGELTPSDERKETYIMTDSIAERHIAVIRRADSESLQELINKRGGSKPRYAFLTGGTTYQKVSDNAVYDFEAFFVEDYHKAYEMLENGGIDAFIEESPTQAAFDGYGDIVADNFFPLLFSPVAFATQTAEYEPIINALQRSLDSGAITYLNELYNEGHREYLRKKLFSMFTDEEKEYIKNNPVIRFAAEPENYPINFFNKQENEWQGIAYDILKETNRYTGLRFEIINGTDASFADLVDLLESGEAHLISELIRSEDREGLFLWPEIDFLRDRYALVSKSEFGDISINELLYTSVGVGKGTAYAYLFNKWFPNHKNVTEYETTYAAFNALERGEIDLVMSSQHQLLLLTNFREHVGYKCNLIFELYFDSTFGVNINHPELRSILDKTMRLIDTEGISGKWMRKTYDYRVKLEQERTPWLVGAGVLLVVIIFMFVMIVRNRNIGKKLENIVCDRTSALMEKQHELEKTVEIAESASRVKSSFLANMSHEIRTPMNAIIGMTELLLHEQLSDSQQDRVNDIKVSANSLLGIINDILDMSKIEAGKLELNPIHYDLRILLDNIIAMFKYVAQEKGLQFIYEHEREPSQQELPQYLFGDDLRLKQILTNICGNAIKFTESGHVKLKVITETGINNSISFEISDTGRGIKEEDVPELFKAFQQTDKINNRGIVGTGLGLSISKAFAEMMGGDITVTSNYGKGSVFTVRIPFEAGDGDKVAPDEGTMKSDKFYAPEAKILITDDNVFNLKVAAGLLKLYRIDAVTAESGKEAIKAVQGTDFDLVFMDHMMPEMDGVETVAEIRKLGGKFTELCIVALTANAVRGSKEMFLENDFNDFLSKPIVAAELNAILKKWIPPGKIKNASADEDKTPEADESAGGKDIMAQLSEIEEINADIGLSYVSGIEEMYTDALKLIYEKLRPECKKMNGFLESGDIKNFAILVHAMKSMLLTIGAAELSQEALALEQAAKSGEEFFCISNYPELEEKLFVLSDKLSALFPGLGTADIQKQAGDKAVLEEQLKAAFAAIKEFNSNEGIEAVNKLLVYDFGEEINGLLENTLVAFQNFDCIKAENFLKEINNPF